VSWHAAMVAVRDHGRPRVDHAVRLGASHAAGLDQSPSLAAIAERPTRFVIGIVDLDAGRLADVLPARSATAVTGSGITSARRARVTKGACKARSLCPIVPMRAGFAASARLAGDPAARQLRTERADNARARTEPGSARSVDLFADDGISDARRVADPHGVNLARCWTSCDRVLYARNGT
jgi:hypothetical protein